jgi:hypothetical protein
MSVQHKTALTAMNQLAVIRQRPADSTIPPV